MFLCRAVRQESYDGWYHITPFPLVSYRRDNRAVHICCIRQHVGLETSAEDKK